MALVCLWACTVYEPSLLTGDSQAEGGSGAGDSSQAGDPAGEGGTFGGSSGNNAGGSGGSASGKIGTGGSEAGQAGGSGANGGANGGTKGGEATTASGAGGTSPGGAGTAGDDDGGQAGQGGVPCAPPADCCPDDNNKTEPGVCGCGVADTDTDMDGVADCQDTCMGLVDADCTALRNSLVHRYSFNGSGTRATDSQGTAHGTIVNATLGGTGTLTLSGGDTASPPHVRLPSGIVSALTNASFEVWLTWTHAGTTGESWQRVFDFGTSGTAGAQASTSSASMSYLFLTARAGTSPNVLRLTYTSSGPSGETAANGAQALARGSVQHLVSVVDDQNGILSLYLNGAFQDSVAFAGSLSAITDVNNWLGRSQFAADYELSGVYDEFRIYDSALTPGQVRTSFIAGPNAYFLTP